MKITVLNGSPKGETGVTFQYVRYMQKHHPECEFEVFHVGREIKRIERKPDMFSRIVDAVEGSDGVLWCTPVYILLVPSQLKRFIELISERGVEAAFEGRYCTSITTSAHFYDHTAHNYLRAVSEDLGMRYVDGYSAEFNDLLKADERAQILNFTDRFLRHMRLELPTARAFASVRRDMPEYSPGPVDRAPASVNARVTVLTDCTGDDVNLRRMIEVFVRALPCRVELVNLNDVNLRGGCLGCLGCIYNASCVYKDGMRELVESHILGADAVVYAGSIRDRYLSSRWKMYADRMFYNGHRPLIGEKPTAWLVSGPLSDIPNLRQILEASSENPRSRNVGIVTDESEDPERTTALLRALADELMWSLEVRYSRPPSFLGVGGHKVFRDLIYSMRGVFKADHEFYRENGMYDFPQKDLKAQAFNLMFFTLRRFPSMREKMYREGNRRMISPLEKILRD